MPIKLLALAAAAFAQTAADPPEGAGPTRARAALQQYFTTNDYPRGALWRRAEGIVRFTVEIDDRGVPTRCTIDTSAGDPDLDRVTCEIMMSRARFSPARDARGRPVADRVSSRVRWTLPDPLEAYAFAPLRITSRIGRAAGRVECAWTSNGEEIDAAQGDICALVVGPEGMDLLDSLDGDVELTMVLLFHPDGAAAPPDQAVEGAEPLVELAARVSVSPEGTVSDCRATRRTLLRPVGLLREAPDFCLHPMFVKPRAFWMGGPGDANRFATATMRVYLRATPGG